MSMSASDEQKEIPPESAESIEMPKSKKPRSQKKREKREEWMKIRGDVRKEKRKERKLEQKKESKSQLGETLDKMSEADKEAYIQARKHERIQAEIALRKHLDDCFSSGNPKIVYNCSFVESMNYKEVCSLVKQLQYSYNVMKTNLHHPVQLHVTSLLEDEEDVLRARFMKEGGKSWKMHSHSSPYWEVFAKEISEGNLVVLSPDGEKDLEGVEEGKVYVIGGLVDRTVLANQTKGQAEGLGKVEGAPPPPQPLVRRLPIRQHIQSPLSPVLNVNTVTEILVKMLREGASWGEVLEECVPSRKQAQGPGRRARRLNAKRERRIEMFGGPNGEDPLHLKLEEELKAKEGEQQEEVM